jgi:hypothetical protein
VLKASASAQSACAWGHGEDGRITKNLPSGKLLIKPKTLHKAADGKFTIDVHRVNPKVSRLFQAKKNIQERKV